jgi:hypothetical protein
MTTQQEIIENSKNGKSTRLHNEYRVWVILAIRGKFIIKSWNRELAAHDIIEERQKEYSDLSKLESAIKRILAKV